MKQSISREQESSSNAHSASAKESSFVDKRPSATTHRQLNEMVEHSPQTIAQRKRQQNLFGTLVQRQQEEEEEKPVQAKAASETSSKLTEAAPQPNNTGLPDQLKTGIESLSGMAMDNVKVHYNSSAPAQLQAHAYAQGNEIHLAPGQEQHLPHEAWHVVQQAQGRVQPNVQAKGIEINDDAGLETEADVMGERAAHAGAGTGPQQSTAGSSPRENIATVPAPLASKVKQLRLPPRAVVATQIAREGTDNALLVMHRLLHMEIAQGRLLGAGAVPYADVDAASAIIFPNGVFDADAYDVMYGANQQYADILPSSQAINDQDWATLEPALARAASLAGQCVSRTLWIKEIFGNNVDDVAAVQATYRAVAARLGGFGRANFTIDYHGDDAEKGVAGFTIPGSGKIQVSPGMIAGDANKLAVLLLHEGCHEVDAAIIDCGYYGTANFNTMSTRQKKTNAAHYEDVARRLVGNSRYNGQTFAPRAQQALGQNPRAELIRKVRVANEGLRELWSKTSSFQSLMRDIAAGVSTLSPEVQLQMADLTKRAFSLPEAHREGAPSVTKMDLALLEATARVFYRAQTEVNRFKSEEDHARRLLLVAMTPRQLAIDAINRVGGFQGIDREINVTVIEQLRTALVIGGLPDPFPAFEEE